MRNIICFVMSLFLCVSMVSCKSSDYETTAWKTLAVTATLYNETMLELGAMHSAGTFSDENDGKGPG